MTMASNKELVRKCWLECFNQKDMSIVDKLVMPDYVWHGPSQEINGREGIKQFVAMICSGLSDSQMSMDKQVAEGDEVATHWRIQARHTGDLFGIAPTGKRVTLTGIVISRLAHGQIAEEWEEFDQLGLLQQIGAIPVPEQAHS